MRLRRSLHWGLLAGISGLMLNPSLALANPYDSPNDWNLMKSEDIKYFMPGPTPPEKAIPATPEQAAAMARAVDPAVWELIHSERVSYFVASDSTPVTGPLPPDLASPAGSADWQLIHSQDIQYFVASTTPPQGMSPATDAQYRAIMVPSPPDLAVWELLNVENYNFFVPKDVKVVKVIPKKPVATRGISYGQITNLTPFLEYGPVQGIVTGNKVKSVQSVTKVTPRIQALITTTPNYLLATGSTRVEVKPFPPDQEMWPVRTTYYSWQAINPTRTTTQVATTSLREALPDKVFSWSQIPSVVISAKPISQKTIFLSDYSVNNGASSSVRLVGSVVRRALKSDNAIASTANAAPFVFKAMATDHGVTYTALIATDGRILVTTPEGEITFPPGTKILEIGHVKFQLSRHKGIWTLSRLDDDESSASKEPQHLPPFQKSPKNEQR